MDAEIIDGNYKNKNEQKLCDELIRRVKKKKKKKKRRFNMARFQICPPTHPLEKKKKILVTAFSRYPIKNKRFLKRLSNMKCTQENSIDNILIHSIKNSH